MQNRRVPRFSIARLLLVALLGLTVVLAIVAALGVSSLYDARRDYEDAIARTYAAEAATANVLAAGVVEEAILRSDRGGRADRRRAAQAFTTAAAAASEAAKGDRRSEMLLGTVVAGQESARRAAGNLDARSARARRRATRTVGLGLQSSRIAARELVARQAVRREAARERAGDRSTRATVSTAVAGGLAILAALALVSALVAGLRRPLENTVTASRALAGGDLSVRVPSQGPDELRQLAAAFNSMAGDLESARARIEASRRRLATVIESLGDALLVTDKDSVITQVNPRAQELVPDMEIGARVELASLEDVLHGEVELLHRGSTLAVTAASLPSGEGFVWTLRDVTERARLEQAKSDFVATASHELRSPLTSIKGFIELLLRGKLPDREHEFAEIILISTNRLVELVNDLLDVARIESGALEVQRRPIAVSEAIDEVVTLMQPRVEARGQTLTAEYEPDFPAAFADPSRVRQIVTNLVTNAHLYTPEGGSIVVRLHADDDHVSIAVSDTGRGMSPQELEKVFERFQRGEQASDRTGTGLGLSIVKSLVELHEGHIDVESELGKGTTMTVRLPRARPIDEPASPRQALRGKRVLIIEDEPEIARLIAEHLAPYEVETAVVASGEDALRRLKVDRFDAVTLDILLGGIDGFEVLQALRGDRELRRTPVAIVSVRARDEALAGEWVVSKPIDADELTDALGSAIQAGRARVLVVGRRELQREIGGALGRLGIEHDWADTGAEAARLCEEHHFEVALVDAGMRAPQTALAALDLRGRRLRRSVIVFSDGKEAPGLARLHGDPVTVEDATDAVLAALRGPEAP